MYTDDSITQPSAVSLVLGICIGLKIGIDYFLLHMPEDLSPHEMLTHGKGQLKLEQIKNACLTYCFI